MSRLFMHGTSLGEIEQLMMMAPNFPSRRSGIIINNYFNCEGGGIKCSCPENIKEFSCYTDICFYLAGREGDEIKYKDLVQDCFGKIKNYSLKQRLKFLANNFKGEVFLNSKHKERFYGELNKRKVDMEDISARFIAILFLLTADEGLWKVSKDLIRPNVFDLKGICLKGIDTNGYALYQTAKTLSTGKECIRINELADRELIDNHIFKVIVNSALINRYGSELFLINK